MSPSGFHDVASKAHHGQHTITELCRCLKPDCPELPCRDQRCRHSRSLDSRAGMSGGRRGVNSSSSLVPLVWRLPGWVECILAGLSISIEALKGSIPGLRWQETAVLRASVSLVHAASPSLLGWISPLCSRGGKVRRRHGAATQAVRQGQGTDAAPQRIQPKPLSHLGAFRGRQPVSALQPLQIGKNASDSPRPRHIHASRPESDR